MTTDVTTPERARPEAIKAVPVRHPGRWIAAAIVALLAAMFLHLLITNQAFQWSFIWDNAFTPVVVQGARTTIILTIISMLIGVALGVVLAVMRLSPNPIVSGAAWVYVWFFRAVPRVVLLVLFGGLGVLWPRVEFGIPFDQQIAHFFGIDFSGRFVGFDSNTVFRGFVAAVLGLALSEAAYMAEIVRAGIESVSPGQSEAASALGMRRMLTMRRIVLPQAMRVIVPPTGNETIAMIKDTALVAYVPAYELWFQLQAIGNRTFQPFPMLVAACLWYLAMTSVMMVGQHFLEKRFSRGVGSRSTRAQRRMAGITAQHGKGGGG